MFIKRKKEGYVMNPKNEKKIQIIVLTICLAIFGGLFVIANIVYEPQDERVGLYYDRGQVVGIIHEVTEDPDDQGIFLYQLLEVRMLSGEFRGATFEVNNNLMSHRLRAFDAGDRVIVELTDNFIQVFAPDRSTSLLAAVGIFLVLLCLIGGKRGILAMGGLLFSLAAIVFVLVPLTLAGIAAIPIALLISILIIIVSTVLLAGVNSKSLAAILGCITGVLIAALFAFLVGHFAFISGYHTEQAGSLIWILDDVSLSGIFISGLIIAATGAIADTSMTIASAMAEIKQANPAISLAKLRQAGLNVGRDVMGTMSNTLILAFVGSGFSLILFITSLNVSWIEFINNDSIGIEVIQGIAGSIGIVLTVPITTFITAKLLSYNLHKNKSSGQQ